jgi:hypothetical protein
MQHGYASSHSMVMPHPTAWVCLTQQHGYASSHRMVMSHPTERLCLTPQHGYASPHSMVMPHPTAWLMLCLIPQPENLCIQPSVSPMANHDLLIS